MTVGGVDIVLPVPPGVPVAELVLGCVRRMWPGARFLDGDGDCHYPIRDSWVVVHGGTSREFFLFRDEEAALSWRRFGAAPENWNTMIHVLVAPDSGEVTLVCDERVVEIEGLIRELDGAFRNNRFPSAPARHAA